MKSLPNVYENFWCVSLLRKLTQPILFSVRNFCSNSNSILSCSKTKLILFYLKKFRAAPLPHRIPPRSAPDGQFRAFDPQPMPTYLSCQTWLKSPHRGPQSEMQNFALRDTFSLTDFLRQIILSECYMAVVPRVQND